MDLGVIENIPPAIPRASTMLKQKEIILEEAGVIFIDEKFDTSNKGKGPINVTDSCGETQEPLAGFSFNLGAETTESVNRVGLKSCSPASHNLVNLDGHSPDYNDDDCIDLISEDFMDVDEYSILQAHFDHVDIPPGIEAPIPWFPGLTEDRNKLVTGSSSLFSKHQIKSDSLGLNGIDSSSSLCPAELDHLKKTATSVGSSNSVAEMDGPDIDLFLSRFPLQAAHRKKKLTASQYREKSAALHQKRSSLNLSLGGEPSKHRWFLDSFKSKKKQVTELGAMKLQFGVDPFFVAHNTSNSVYKQVDTSTYQSNFPVHMDPSNHSPGVGPSTPWLPEYFKPIKASFMNYSTPSIYDHPFDPLDIPPGEVVDMPWVQDSFQNWKHAVEGSSTNAEDGISNRDLDEILKKFEIFKKFDTVEDHLDHHYTALGTSVDQPPKIWAKRIQEEWKILEKDLPDTIFVRVYETRMDLLRAVIVGAEGTPYHDGLFFFDVYFPTGYPNVPPLVYYHSGGLRLNPNLYNCGKVCLSLLNTWSGDKNEKWIPGVSTMLQVFVSVQGLILNTKPYFNEPGFANMSGSMAGEMRSQQYNEETYILSLKTMMYTIRRPPKHFEDFVLGHFRKRAHDILVACKAYMDGAQVGSLVQNGVQDVDVSDKSCSNQFKESLVGSMQMLVKEFTRIGATNCEKFVSPTTREENSVGYVPIVAT